MKRLALLMFVVVGATMTIVTACGSDDGLPPVDTGTIDTEFPAETDGDTVARIPNSDGLFVYYIYDERRDVGCWVTEASTRMAISCIPGEQLRSRR